PFDHHEVDIRKVDLEEAFEVSGEQLMFPGDSSLGASAGNLINCRCSFALQTKRDENGRMMIKPRPMTVTAEGMGGLPEIELIEIPASGIGIVNLLQQLIAGAQLGSLLGLTFDALFNNQNEGQ